MIIGLTGKNAAGKGELAQYLKSKGFTYFSLSDALRDEATSKDLDHSRDTLIWLGTDMRKRFGNAILAQKINEKIKAFRQKGRKNFVIDSIRNPGEITELRKNKNFLLIGVQTDPEIRFQRLLSRGRTGDSKTLKEFMEHEARENNNGGAGQQLDKCLEMADKIISSNGTIEEANKELETYLGLSKEEQE